MNLENLKSKSKSKYIIGIVLIATVGIFSGYFLLFNNGFQNVSVDKAYEMISDKEEYPDLIILDVRTQDEFDEGHIENATLIPHDSIAANLDLIEDYKDTEIIVYCRSGSRSFSASKNLVELGFTKIYNMEGGIGAWIDASYPIVTV